MNLLRRTAAPSAIVPVGHTSNMKRLVTRRAIVLLIVAALIPSVYFWWGYQDRQSALTCIQEWGRLAPFPKTARNVQIETTGGMFTRGFRASFQGTPKEIEQWLSESPGIRDATAEEDGAGTRYNIRAGGGATHAEATVDSEHTNVSIRVYWS
jgi:hypothetical protein